MRLKAQAEAAAVLAPLAGLGPLGLVAALAAIAIAVGPSLAQKIQQYIEGTGDAPTLTDEQTKAIQDAMSASVSTLPTTDQFGNPLDPAQTIQDPSLTLQGPQYLPQDLLSEPAGPDISFGRSLEDVNREISQADSDVQKGVERYDNMPKGPWPPNSKDLVRKIALYLSPVMAKAAREAARLYVKYAPNASPSVLRALREIGSWSLESLRSLAAWANEAEFTILRARNYAVSIYLNWGAYAGYTGTRLVPGAEVSDIRNYPEVEEFIRATIRAVTEAFNHIYSGY